MLTVAEARARIVSAFAAVNAESVPLADAAARALAANVVAKRTQPPLDMSAMDGYAVRAADVGVERVTLKVVEEIAAGGVPQHKLQSGEAARIATGAPLPDGADTIVIQENTTRDGEHLTVRQRPQPGRHIRKAGLDFRNGDTVLAAPRRLSGADITLAAAAGASELGVRRRPRVAIISTGDEIVRPGEKSGPSQIVGSSVYGLIALLRECGAESIDLGIARDDANALAATARRAANVDLIVTLGGASVGDRDLIRSGLAPEGLELDFWKIAMRPGKPLMFGKLKATPLLGLPGNPVSALVCAHLFLKSAVDAMLGLPAAAPAFTTVRLGRDLAANDDREDYLRATLSRAPDGTLTATPFEKQDSSMLSALSAAGALVMRPPHAPAAKAGDPAPALILREP